MSETSSNYRIQGNTGEWEVVIGLEVHAQVASKAKLFSGASTTFGAEPNSNVAFVDAAMPGMLPVVNEFCVAQAVRTDLRAIAAGAVQLKLHRNCNPGGVSKRRHAGRYVAARAWRQRSRGNPNNGQLAGAIRPALPTVSDQSFALQLGGARLD